MEWLILLLLPIPFFAMYKMATWLDRMEGLGKLERLPASVRKILRPILGLLWWAILMLGTPYFIYTDAKLIVRLSKYGDCPCDAGFPEKQFFCLYGWDFLAEIRRQPRRTFTSSQLNLISVLRKRMESGEPMDAELVSVLRRAIEKQETDMRDLKNPAAYPPIVPQCENAP